MAFEWSRKSFLIGLFTLLEGAQPGHLSASELPPSTQPAFGASVASSLQPDRPDEWAVTILGGWLNEANFSGILVSPWTSSFDDTQMVSGTVSKRVYEFDQDSLVGRYWFVDLEVGAGQRLGIQRRLKFGPRSTSSMTVSRGPIRST